MGRLDTFMKDRESPEIRVLHTLHEFAAVKRIEDAVWQEGEGTPAALLKVFADHGGLILGAFVKEEMVGMAVAMPARMGDHWYLHSHMMAIMPGYRSLGLGSHLKQEQVRWAKTYGYEFVGWTFDPLQVRNAIFNLRVLKAHVLDFAPNYYGTMGDTLNGNFPSHRFFAVSEDLEGISQKPQGLLPIPQDITALRREHPAQAQKWADRYARFFASPTRRRIVGLVRSPLGRWCYAWTEARPLDQS
ncbi:MAG: GNAT family N-acetyltransferase [Sulfobacillus thermotolerans]|nr:GNAT family N-acetyltransferase [Sulfobacillus thermotolerans]